MVKASKVLGVKSRATGKYDLAKKMAIQLVNHEYVKILDGGNFISLGREDITFPTKYPGY